MTTNPENKELGTETPTANSITEKAQLNYKSLIEKTCENGDLVILGQKGTCKTTLLQNLARELRKDALKHVIIFETFPKWIHEFDNMPYLIIKDEDIQEKENENFDLEGIEEEWID